MKTNYQNLCLITFLITVLFSCSSNDSEPTELEGTWKLTSLKTESKFDFNKDGKTTNNLFEETPCYDDDFITMRSDGTIRIVNALTFIGINEIGDNDYEYYYKCLTGFDIESTWVKDGKKLMVEDERLENMVTTVNGNTMTVLIKGLFNMPIYKGGSKKEDVELVYIKQ